MKQAARHQLFTAASPMVMRIIPELAKEIGLNESIMLLQVDFWINHADNYKDGQWWTYQSVRQMQEKAFPYWSLMTINRTVKSLETKGYITIGNYNKRKSDSTRWITLKYKALEKLASVKVVKVSGETVSESDSPSQNDTGAYQNDTPSYQNDTNPQQNDTTLPETPKENQEITTIGVGEVFRFYEDMVGSMTGHMVDVLKDAITDYSAEWLIDAMKIAIEQNKRNWKYTEGILKRWKHEGKKNNTGSKKPKITPIEGQVIYVESADQSMFWNTATQRYDIYEGKHESRPA